MQYMQIHCSSYTHTHKNKKLNFIFLLAWICKQKHSHIQLLWAIFLFNTHIYIKHTHTHTSGQSFVCIGYTSIIGFLINRSINYVGKFNCQIISRLCPALTSLSLECNCPVLCLVHLRKHYWHGYIGYWYGCLSRSTFASDFWFYVAIVASSLVL